MATSALEQLWNSSIKFVGSLFQRYWLLAARPADYFDKFIKDKTGRDLRQTIGHTLGAVAAVTLIFGALFSMKGAEEMIPAYAQVLLTKQYVFMMALLLVTAPALLLFYIVYRVIRGSISELLFIYFSVLTFWLLMFFAIFVLEAMFLPFAALNWFWPTSSKYLIWLLAFPLIWVFYTWFSAFYYVPLVLFEKSTKRSTMFASSLCVAAFALFFAVAMLVTQMAGLNQSSFPADPESARNATGSD